MTDVVPLRTSILRGGTSRGVFFLEDLPTSREAIEPILLDVFGSPDARQINGLGGATSQTSKAAIIGPPSRPDADVDYTFAQVSVNEPPVDWGGNCGNISAAVGPFAIDQGLVPRRGSGDHRPDPQHQHEQDHRGRGAATVTAGADLAATTPSPACRGPGARILLDFADPAGSVTGSSCRRVRPCDELRLADGRRSPCPSSTRPIPRSSCGRRTSA